MYSSPKFLVPRVIAGFGPDEEVVVLLLLPPPPPPHAARPIRSATPKEIANAALAARRVCLRNIRCPPSLALPLRACPPGDPTPPEPADATPRAERARGQMRSPAPSPRRTARRRARRN